MNTQPLDVTTNVILDVAVESDILVESGFSQDEVMSLLWLRQWYQNGGSDRVELLRRFEFLKLLVINNKIEL